MGVPLPQRPTLLYAGNPRFNGSGQINIGCASNTDARKSGRTDAFALI